MSKDLERITIDAARWKINAMVGGSGPLVVFLHGIGLSWRWWQPLLPHVAQKYSVCAIDLPGSGDSSPIHEKPSPERYAALVTEVIAHLRKGPAVLVGHSLGGYVAVQSALHQAAGVRALALIAPGGFGQVENVIMRALSFPGVGQTLSFTGRNGVKTLLKSMVRNRAVLTEEMYDWLDLSPFAREQFLFELRLGLNLGRTLPDFIIREAPEIDVPIWLGWGRHDSVFSIETGYQAAQVLQVPPPHIFEHSSHMPHLEEQSSFEAELEGFLSGLP